MKTISHIVEYEVQKEWFRINSLARTYCSIAESALNDFYLEQVNPIEDPGKDQDATDYFAQEDRTLNASIKSIVFSAMACEAAIYDLAAIHLTDDYALVLDKLDLVGKWTIVPSLVCGRTFGRNSPAVNCLRALTKMRNSLVHFKSKPSLWAIESEEFSKLSQKAAKQMRQINDNCASSFQTIILLSLELNQILKTPTGVLPFYETEIIGSNDEHTHHVLKLINRCREIHSKQVLN